MFENLGQVIADIPKDELVKAMVEQSVTDQRRQAEALEEINNTLWHLVKLLKPWAEREKRKNLIEQDPDYLQQVIKQVQNDRKARKAKGKKRK
jgi:hypothetical protein